MELMVTALIGLILLGIALIGWAEIGKARAARTAHAAIARDYETKDIFVSDVDRGVIAVSFPRKLLVMGKIGGHLTPYDFRKIVRVEVIEDGHTMTKTDRSSQFAGVMIGGAAFGPLGAAVGGLTGATRSRAEVRELSLKVVVDDRYAPVHVIRFLRAPTERGVDPNGIVAKRPKALLDRFHAHVVNAMRQAERGL